MISYLKECNTHIVTIDDDSGKDGSIDVHFEDNGGKISIYQLGGYEITLTPLQAYLLKEILDVVVKGGAKGRLN